LGASENPSPRQTESSAPQIQQQNQETQKQESAASPEAPALNQIQSTPTQTPAQESDTQIERQLVGIEGKIAGFTLLLVVVGAFQFFAALFQVKASQRAADAADAAAVAAKESFRGSRPFLVLRRPEILNFKPGIGDGFDDVLGVQFQLRNYGEGPAAEIEVYGRVRVITGELSDTPDFTGCHRVALIENVIAAHGRTNGYAAMQEPIKEPTGLVGMASAADFSLTQEQYFDILADRREGMHIVFCGTATFEDVFGEGYEMGFGMIYKPPSERLPKGGFIPASHAYGYQKKSEEK
jgi:hypothetical protein